MFEQQPTQQKFNLDDGTKFHINIFGNLNTHKAVVLIGAAMGTDEKYYRKLAMFLAHNGYLSITFNYTGIGKSPAQLKKCDYGMADWAHKNIDLLLDYAKKEFANSRIIWLAHSAGGQILGMCENTANIDKIVFVSAGVGYWRLNANALKRKAHLLWYFIVPAFTSIFGYFPGKKLGIVGNLPKKAIYDWRKACLNKNYLQGVFPQYAANYAKVSADIVNFYPLDDEMLSVESLKFLHGQYITAKSKIVKITPEDLGVKHIGHMGLFRSKYKDSFWRNYLLPELEK